MHIDPGQYALNEGFCEYMEAAGYGSKEKEEPDDQLYKLGLKTLAKCEDIDLKAVESMAKDTEKFKDILAQMMYEILTGHPYEGEKMMSKQSEADEIKKIIFNGCKTIVFWADGTKTIVTKERYDTWDPVMALCAAYAKKNLGSVTQIQEIINKKSNIEKYKNDLEQYTDEAIRETIEKIQEAQEEM